MSVLDPKMTRAVDQYIDEQHERFSDLGKLLFDTFGFDEKNNRIATQVRNLQQVASSAVRFADIEDFVKNQMGKKGNKDWQRIGDHVLKVLEKLRNQSTEMTDNPAEAMAVRLRLARGWVRAVVSEYLYQVAQKQMGAAT